MQSYGHDTASSSLRGKGKGKGKAVLTTGEPAPPQLSSFPKQAMPSRPRISHNTFSRPQDTLGESQTAGNLGTSFGRDPVAYRSSTTWTSSSGDIDINSEDEEAEDRTFFVAEYNRLAKKHGIRAIVIGDFPQLLTVCDVRTPLLLTHTDKRLTAGSQGIFRIPGSVRIVNALYDYYFADERDEEIATTTRYPNLPTHLNCSVHDVASTFKRFLSGLPGGILGSLSLFDALVAIHSQLRANPESTKTKESKLRARLIALAIGTVRSRYRRELICAVFGILCLVGRVAELAPREDAKGKPLPTSDLMGYNALAIIFGPLLIGDLITSYSMKVADPAAGLVLLPVSPPKSKKQKRTKVPKDQMPSMPTIDRIHVINDITEMLIVHWREVVRHLRNMSAIHTNTGPLYSGSKARRIFLNSSASETFSMRRPPDWSAHKPSSQVRARSNVSIAASPTPSSSKPLGPPNSLTLTTKEVGPSKTRMNSVAPMEPLSVRRQRIQTSSSAASHRLPRGQSLNALSPTAEESPLANHHFDDLEEFDPVASSTPKSYKSRIDNGLGKAEFASSNEALRMQSRSFVRDSVSGALVLDPAMPCYSLKQSKTFNGLGPSSKSQPFYENPHELAAEDHFNSPAVTYDTLAKQRAVSTNSQQDLTSSHASRVQSRAPSAGETPLRCERLPSVQKALPALPPPSPTEDQVLASEQQTNSEQKAEFANDDHLAHAKNALEALQPTASESEGVSPISGVETFPSFHPSVVENAKSPPEHLPNPAHASKKQTSQAPGKNMSSDKSSPWSLRNILGRKSPSVGHADEKAERLDGAPTGKSSPISRWKELVRNSPTSPLAALRERRLFRSSAHESPRRSAESTETVEKKPATPEWKRKLLSRKLEDQKKPTTLSPDKKLMFEKSSQPSPKKPNISPANGHDGSPIKAAPNLVNRPLSQRSSSRPVGGAVKAMAALFDNTSNDSPDGPLTGRSRSDLRTSASFASGHTKTQSPAKSTKSAVVPSDTLPKTPSKKYNDDPQDTGMVTRRVYRTSVGRRKQTTTDSSIQNTPSTFPKVALRPTGFVFSAAKNEPKASPSKALSRDRGLSRPPSLGTMVPPREEPPVAQHLTFARPPSATSSHSHLSGQPLGDDLSTAHGSPLPTSGGSPRPRSGNGLLHAQIRSLQRHLQSKNEEILQLKRQLETRENVDVGTLSEKLREAKRDCAMWRDRAEAAEKRIAVFEKFAAKARALRGGNSPDTKEKLEATTQEAIGQGSMKLTRQSTPLAILRDESDETAHTEDQDTFNDRLRKSIRRNTRPAGDGAMSSPSGDESIMDLSLENMLHGTDYAPLTWRGRALWIAAEELLDMQDEMEHRL
ncbi:rhoGAP domain-containing protein [Apiospora rasikravindrae]|uniref:RhoGAP domain-containing protein n=1 Tax=Apiospora rasikravindrae TaxID=990691 RepID=A0ABR1RRF8_9PEZI